MDQANSKLIQVWVSIDNKNNLIRYTESYVAGARIATLSEREYYLNNLIQSYRNIMKEKSIEYPVGSLAIADPTDPHVES